MLTPVPMVRVEILVLDRDLDDLTVRVGSMAILHPISVGQLGPWAAGLAWPEIVALGAEYSAIGRRLEMVAEALRLDLDVADGPARVSPKEMLAEAASLLDRVEPEVRSLESRLNHLLVRGQRLDGLEGLVEMLAGLRVDLGRLRGLHYLHPVLGLLPPENLRRLDESLQGVPHLLLPFKQVRDRVILIAFCRQEDADVLDRALQSAYLEQLEIPPELSGTPDEAERQLQASREELRRESAEVELRLEDLHHQWGSEVARVAADVDANAAVVGLWEQAGRTGRTRLLSGWAPEDHCQHLVAAAEAAAGGRVVLSFHAPSPSDRPPAALAPTELRNPALIRPFEGLTRTYGLPDYWDFDPTPIAGLLFALFFGAMFGDLGQGLVLLILGVLIAGGRVVRNQRDFGWILAVSGGTAMLFGVLYGEAFGSGDLIPAVWFRPLEDPLRLIGIAVALGVVVLSLGLILGVLTAWRRRDLAALFLGQNGLAGLWLYWGLIAAAWIVVAAPALFSWWILTLLLGAPALLLFLHGPIARALGWGGDVEDGTYAIQAGVETFDLAVRLVSNTLSFLRVGAFALGHIGLGLTIFALMEVVRGVPVAQLGILLLGNLVIIVLEALIVGIQALRLEYYELFGKFLHGQGVAYQPFRLGGELFGAWQGPLDSCQGLRRGS